MSSLTPFPIIGYQKGLQNYQKPALIPDQAWSELENAYSWRERILKREGNYLMGRLQRDILALALGNTVAATLTYTFPDILATLGVRATEPNAELKPGTVNISITGADVTTFNDNGDGTFTVAPPGLSAGSYVDYATGTVVLKFSATAGGGAIKANFSYYPALPGMGIWQQDQATVNIQNTIWWDRKYAYIYSGASFGEFIPPPGNVVWTGSDSQFFWAYNYQGATGSRLLFVTNFNKTDPMYYTDGSSWTSFKPLITATDTLYQARILIPYYGRLLALNTYEGTTAGGAGAATQFFSRCRFSWEFDPTNVDAFRSDLFGKGGFVDAPTQEQITGATFVKNTLVVDFEYSTWQLRYVGNYGLPFVWERVSADFGSGSTFSGVLFDNERLNIGDVAITSGNSIGVQRIDLDIPDQVFDFQNNQTNMGAARVWGIRNYQKEVVYWNYPDSQTQAAAGVTLTFPDKVLLYNYRNKSWAIFRDNVTCFGTFQQQSSINWNSTTVTWDDEDVTWADPINQAGFPQIVKLNQQGFAHQYACQMKDDASLSVKGVSITGGGILQVIIPNHNLIALEIIYLNGLKFIDSSTFLPILTSLNNAIYQVQSVIDANTIQISLFNLSQQNPAYVLVGIGSGLVPFSPNLATSIYVGGGTAALYPRPSLITKDINLYQKKGMQTKLSRIDFLMEPQPTDSFVTVNLILNSAPSLTATLTIAKTNFSIQNNTTFNPGDSIDYYWFSFYQTLSAQYFKIQLTYSDYLMNLTNTHNSNLTLYAINAWTRPGGRLYSGGS